MSDDKVVFSDADYNRGAKDFDPNEVRVRARCILTSTNEHLDEYEQHEGTAKGFLAAGKINETEGDLAYAVRWYRRAIAADPELHEARARLALTLVRSSRHDAGEELKKEALAQALKLVELAPNFVFPALVRRRPLSAWTVLGDAQRANANSEAAVEAYIHAVAAEPRDMYAAGHLGVLLLAKGDTEGALNQLEHVDRQNGVFGQIEAAVRLAAADPNTLLSVQDVVVRRLVVAEPAA